MLDLAAVKGSKCISWKDQHVLVSVLQDWPIKVCMILHEFFPLTNWMLTARVALELCVPSAWVSKRLRGKTPTSPYSTSKCITSGLSHKKRTSIVFELFCIPDLLVILFCLLSVKQGLLLLFLLEMWFVNYFENRKLMIHRINVIDVLFSLCSYINL